MSDDDELAPTAVRWRGEVEISRPPCLVVLYGAELGRRLELHGDPVTIGRNHSCDLVADVEDVSREHCRIVPREGGYALVDSGSTNGTFLGDEQLAPGVETPLEGGECIRIGSLILKFLDGGDIEALYHEEIYRLTIVDGLTGLNNRRFFDEFLAREAKRWQRYRRPFCLVLFDLDGFKGVNDEYGHPGGDSVLQQVSETVREMVRHEACLARLSGDEFGIALPETSLDQARIFAERLRGSVEQTTFWAGERKVVGLTISLGVAELGEGRGDQVGLVEEADRRLYAAKEQGRNCVIS